MGYGALGQIHTARELAARLSLGYAFGVEFLELGLGDEREQATHTGAANDVGYHGAAILCGRPLSRARRVRLEESGGWFDGSRGQRRIGGRMALCAAVALGTTEGATDLVLCSADPATDRDSIAALSDHDPITVTIASGWSPTGRLTAPSSPLSTAAGSTSGPD